jgi:hypothetical protein
VRFGADEVPLGRLKKEARKGKTSSLLLRWWVDGGL